MGMGEVEGAREGEVESVGWRREGLPLRGMAPAKESAVEAEGEREAEGVPPPQGDSVAEAVAAALSVDSPAARAGVSRKRHWSSMPPGGLKLARPPGDRVGDPGVREGEKDTDAVEEWEALGAAEEVGAKEEEAEGVPVAPAGCEGEAKVLPVCVELERALRVALGLSRGIALPAAVGDCESSAERDGMGEAVAMGAVVCVKSGSGDALAESVVLIVALMPAVVQPVKAVICTHREVALSSVQRSE